MPSQLHHATIAALLGLTLAFSACTTPSAQTSGFLPDYPELGEAQDGSGQFWQAEGSDLTSYQQVAIEGIYLHFKEDSKANAVDAEEVAMLVQYFRDSIAEELGDAYPLTEEPGPGVLVLRIALTDLVPGNPAAFTVTKAPYVGVLSWGKKLTTGSFIGVGEAEIEVEMLDGASGERIVVFIDRNVGGGLDIEGGVTEWGHVQNAFASWARRLRAQLDGTAAETATPDASA